MCDPTGCKLNFYVTAAAGHASVHVYFPFHPNPNPPVYEWDGRYTKLVIRFMEFLLRRALSKGQNTNLQPHW